MKNRTLTFRNIWQRIKQDADPDDNIDLLERTSEVLDSGAEMISDFVSDQFFAIVWTLLFSGIFGSLAYALLSWLYSDAYGLIGFGVIVLTNFFLVVIYVTFPRDPRLDEIQVTLTELGEQVYANTDDLEEISYSVKNI